MLPLDHLHTLEDMPNLLLVSMVSETGHSFTNASCKRCFLETSDLFFQATLLNHRSQQPPLAQVSLVPTQEAPLEVPLHPSRTA